MIKIGAIAAIVAGILGFFGAIIAPGTFHLGQLLAVICSGVIIGAGWVCLSSERMQSKRMTDAAIIVLSSVVGMAFGSNVDNPMLLALTGGVFVMIDTFEKLIVQGSGDESP